jgi:hypothetical protein
MKCRTGGVGAAHQRKADEYIEWLACNVPRRTSSSCGCCTFTMCSPTLVNLRSTRRSHRPSDAVSVGEQRAVNRPHVTKTAPGGGPLTGDRPPSPTSRSAAAALRPHEALARQRMLVFAAPSAARLVAPASAAATAATTRHLAKQSRPDAGSARSATGNSHPASGSTAPTLHAERDRQYADRKSTPSSSASRNPLSAAMMSCVAAVRANTHCAPMWSAGNSSRTFGCSVTARAL